jgi:hypothetical protein
MKVHHTYKSCQLPDLFDWTSEMERRAFDHRTSLPGFSRHCSNPHRKCGLLE